VLEEELRLGGRVGRSGIQVRGSIPARLHRLDQCLSEGAEDAGGGLPTLLPKIGATPCTAICRERSPRSACVLGPSSCVNIAAARAEVHARASVALCACCWRKGAPQRFGRPPSRCQEGSRHEAAKLLVSLSTLLQHVRADDRSSQIRLSNINGVEKMAGIATIARSATGSHLPVVARPNATEGASFPRDAKSNCTYASRDRSRFVTLS